MALLNFLLLFMQPLLSTSIPLQTEDMKATMQHSCLEEINNIWEFEDSFKNVLNTYAELPSKLESHIQDRHLEKANAKESDSHKSYEEPMPTKNGAFNFGSYTSEADLGQFSRKRG